MYRIYQNGEYITWASSRDLALMWIREEVYNNGGNYEEFEILDGSDAA